MQYQSQPPEIPGFVKFSGALHEGHGTIQAIIDESASEEPIGGLAAIFSGQESEEGTLFNIFAAITETVLNPIVAPIEFQINVEARTGRVVVPGVLETEIKPIKNPITGDEHSIFATSMAWCNFIPMIPPFAPRTTAP